MASLQALRAAVQRAKLDLDFTKVVAPSSGKISRRYIDPGNLVKNDDTILTTLVSLDPIYAYFDLDERTALRLQRVFREHNIDWSKNAKMPLYLGLADEENFPHRGTINFADNRIDPDTGTWRLRGVFSNAHQLLSPGLFVRVRLPIGEPHSAILVSEQSLSTDQGQKFIYVVNDKNDVVYRRVKVGRLHDGLRVILDGLSTNEKVIVSGLQRVRPDTKANPKVVAMPEQKSEDRGQGTEEKTEAGTQKNERQKTENRREGGRL